MDYKEIQKRLSKCQVALQLLQTKGTFTQEETNSKDVSKVVNILKEGIKNYKNMLKEEKSYLLTPKGGKPTLAKLTDDEVVALKNSDDLDKIKTASGEEIKEQEGINFTVEETKSIAKLVGKGLLKALKQAGDEISRIKAHRIEENSFDIHVTFKDESGEDEFSFYIIEDTLHLVDFSFDKELVDVGVKPSGEAIVHVDHLANELLKHFKSLNEDLNEVNYSHYTTPKHFDICPGAEALRDKLIDGGKSPEELGEWTFKHDELFKLEKAVLKANKADIKDVKASENLRAEIIHLSRELGINADDITYLKGHVDKIKKHSNVSEASAEEEEEFHKKLDTLVHKTFGKRKEELKEGPHQTAYIKIPLKDAKKGLAILDRELGGDFMDIVDNDGDGNLIVYIVNTNDNLATAYDAVMDLQAHDIEVADHNAELDENVTQKQLDDIEASGNIDIAYKKAMELLKSMLTKNEALDHNDPVLMRARVAKMRADDLKKLDAYKKSPEGRAAARAQASAERKEKQARALVQKLKTKRAQIEREMENDPEIEPQGGPVADMYGDQLNKIDNAIEKAASVYNKPMDYDTAVGKGGWGPETNPYMDKGEIERRAASLKSEISDYARRRQRESDYYVSKKDAPPKKYREPKNDYFARRKAEDDYVQENISQEVVNKVSRFITSLANHYDYSEQDAVYAIMQALRAHKGNFDGLNEIKAAKIQKAHDQVVAKMKELAKQYKAGDKSVIPQLKDLTAKKRSLEKQLDNAVAGTHRSQELTELSTDQRNDLVELQNILDDAASLGEQAREVIRQSFPNMLSKADAYGVFNFGSSANRYDTTLESIIEEIEEYYDEEEDLDEIGMFHDPIGYKKSEPNPLVYTKKFVRATDRPGIYIYDIFKNGELVKTLEGGEGDANAYVNKRNKEVWAQEKSEGKYKASGYSDKLKKLVKESLVKEDHSGNPNDKYVVVYQGMGFYEVREGDTIVKKDFQSKEEAQAFADKKNKEQGVDELNEVLRFNVKANQDGYQLVTKSNSSELIISKNGKTVGTFTTSGDDKKDIEQFHKMVKSGKLAEEEDVDELNEVLRFNVKANQDGYQLVTKSNSSELIISKNGKTVGTFTTSGDDKKDIEQFHKMVKSGKLANESKHQGTNYKWPMSQATKDRKEADKFAGSDPKAGSTIKGRGFDWKKEQVNEMDGGQLFDYFKSKGYDITKRRPDGYPPKEGVEGYQVSRGSDRSPQSVIFQYNPSTDQFTISQMSGYRIDQKEAIKAGMRQAGRSWVAGQDSYMTDGNYNPVDISAEGLKDIVDHVMSGLDREAKAQGDFYKDRGRTSGTVDELKAKIASAVKEVVDSRKKKKFKVGDKVTYLGHPGEITKVNKEMTGAITYNVSYDKGTGRTKATNIWNKDGEIKPVNEEEKSFTDYNNKELAAYCKNNPTDKKAAAELHKRAQNLKNLTRTDEAKDNIKKGEGRTKVTNIYNKDGEIKALGVNENLDIKKASTAKLEKLVKQSEDEKVSPAFASQLKLIKKELQSRKKNLQEGATCCGKCGRVHVKGTKCKTPYLKGKSHCRNK